MKKVRLVRASYFVWLAVPLALFALGGAGEPYVIWSYDWRPLGPGNQSDWSNRYYTRCSFIGRAGVVTEYPTNGKCGWVRFARNVEARS